jgi:hypothetical protein
MKLRVWEDSDQAREQSFDTPKVRLGRDPGCELTVDSKKRWGRAS